MNKFNLNKNKDLYYFTIPQFEKFNFVKHLFTTRVGLINSKEKYDFNLDMGLNNYNNRNNTINNFKKLSKIIDSSVDNMVLSQQVHETNIKIVTKEDKGKGLSRKSDYNSIDGLITNCTDVPLVTYYADCVPLFFLDPNKRIIGLAHAGWRGTVKKIAAKMIETMKNKFLCNEQEILVAIGPSIGPCCYEVGKEVFEKFNSNFTISTNLMKPISKNKYMLNLWEANRLVLKEKGVLNRNIVVSNLCTSCNNDLLYSYRKENGNTGRMVAIIKLNE